MIGVCNKERVLSVVIGSNGAGKSSLARAVLDGETKNVKGELGFYTISDNIYNNKYNIYKKKPVVAIGKYTNVCGGVDTVRPLSNAYKIGCDIPSKLPEYNVFMESLLISELFKTPVSFFMEMKYRHGYNVEICFLYASETESLRRVFERNGGKQIKASKVCEKLRRTINNFKRIKALGEFKCLAIDTTKLTKEQVFERFSNWSGLYEER